MHIGVFGGANHLQIRCVRLTITDIFAQTDRKHEALLRHITDLPPNRLYFDLPQVHAINQNLPLFYIIKPGDQINKGSFARPRRSDNGDHFAGIDPQCDIIENFALIVIAKRNIAEFDGTFHLFDRHRVGLVHNFGARIQCLEHTIHRSPRPLQGHIEVYQTHCRIIKRIDPAVERQQFADSQLPMNNARAAIPQHKPSSYRPNDLRDGSEFAIEFHLRHAEPEIVLNRRHEHFRFMFLAHKRFDHRNARQFLLQHAEHGVPAFAQFLTERANMPNKQFIIQNIERHNGNSDEGEPVFNRKQHKQQDENAEQVGKERHEAAGNHILNGVNIARQPRHDFAGLARIVVGKRKPIEMAI